ncbi:MAG: 4-hydroxythreonine-4-phosphate dehydrogenase PdxA [Candidatus Bathyarchaeia archaeon]|nr:4-hydroxythreonine-4-phosphate dehydrogenase PdxA [Candidatus Bathyarchaeota archaeon]
MNSLARPVVGITIGDPAGIGPEISIKALLEKSIFNECMPILVGDLSVLEEVNRRLSLGANFRVIDFLEEARGIAGRIEVIDAKSVDVKDITVGAASATSGRASILYIKMAVEHALRGKINAIATAPINKKAINMAGSEHIGHTEILAALCGVRDPLTMFYVRGLRIFFLTRHAPLAEAIKAVKKERIIEATLRINKALGWIGIHNPRIAIAALNPHAGEDGLIGDEEIREIIPAIKELRDMGLNVVGPLPADSIFHQSLERGYDAILSLYHDQGHIAAKTLDFYGTVAVTLGLPFIRTSVDHGTAYDIAWRGLASPKSLIEAIKLAARLSKIYNLSKG